MGAMSVGAIVLVALVLPASRQEKSGAICLAAVTPEMRESDHGDPTGVHPRTLSYEFSVQVDNRKKVLVPRDQPVRLAGFDLRIKHVVKIFDRSDLIESFFFTFEARGSSNLCLAFTPFYRTWSLQPPEKRPWCKCK
jgi:hypothetical protein